MKKIIIKAKLGVVQGISILLILMFGNYVLQARSGVDNLSGNTNDTVTSTKRNQLLTKLNTAIGRSGPDSLTASSGDKLTATKWNGLVNKVNTYADNPPGYCYSLYNVTTATNSYTSCPAGTTNLLNYYSYFRGGWNGNDMTVWYKNISVCCTGTAISYLQECWAINASCTPAACKSGYTSVKSQLLNDGTDGGDCYNHPRIAHGISVCVKN